ncbi:hypothetical protein [Tenacibaculum phage Larrie]|nr:hypothetical protein [Tenacibaculum phage Larrie]
MAKIMRKKPLERRKNKKGISRPKNKTNSGKMRFNASDSKSRALDMMKKDEEVYEKVFNSSDGKCENCGEELPDIFRYNGKVVARWRFSHIVSKQVAPHLRHDESNFNNLCFECHQKWEFSPNKSKMKIFAKNLKKFPEYLSKYCNTDD